MGWLVLIIAVLVIVGFLIAAKKKGGALGANREAWPYKARPILTDPEQVIYHRLVKALPECIILAQVELSRVLEVTQRENQFGWHKRISGKSLDFVVCLKDTSVVAAIEIDDRTHTRSRRVEADATKERALNAAGIKLLRWKTSELPDEDAIRAAFTR